MPYRRIETYRGFVYPAVIDHVGHMNVASYTARFDEATWHFFARLGFTPSYLAAAGHSFVALDQHTRYRLEVLAGSLLEISTELLEVGRKTIRFVHRMRNSETGAEVAETELVGCYFDLAARASSALPAFARERAAELWTEPEPERAGR